MRIAPQQIKGSCAFSVVRAHYTRFARYTYEQAVSDSGYMALACLEDYEITTRFVYAHEKHVVSRGQNPAAAAGAIPVIRCRTVFSLMGYKGKFVLHRSSWRTEVGEGSSNGNEDGSTHCRASASSRGQARKSHQYLPSDGC